MQIDYENDVVREKVVGRPELMRNEEIVLEVRAAFPVSVVFLVAVATLIPPFIWGVVILLFTLYEKKYNGGWVTNRRLVHFRHVPFTKMYTIQSVPLDLVESVRFVTGSAGDFIDRMLGAGTIAVHVRNYQLVQLVFPEIKKPRVVLKRLEDEIDLRKTSL